MKLMRLRNTADEDPESDPALDLDPVLVLTFQNTDLIAKSELCTMRHSVESLLPVMWHSLELTLRCAA
jgi:hypothetical protein